MLNLVKALDCGHERLDAHPAALGSSTHCVACPGLSAITSVALGPGSVVTNYYRGQLAAAGFSAKAIAAMEAGR